jgi:hypothetical protein
MNAVAEQVAEPIKLDIGCGKNKKPGYTGIDIRQFDGVDVELDAGKDRWPYDDSSVTEVHASHFVEHLDAGERIHFVNELYRVLIPKGTASIITPHWASQRAYGDLTHKWPPVAEMWFYYLDKNWRAINAPHNDQYTCDFNCVWGYSMHQSLTIRNAEYQQHAMSFWKEACQDMHATMTARK